MRTQSRDTPLAIERLQIARTRALSLEQKVASIQSGAALVAAANLSPRLPTPVLVFTACTAHLESLSGAPFPGGETSASSVVSGHVISPADAAHFVARQYDPSLAGVFLHAVSTRTEESEQWSFERFDLLAALAALMAALAHAGAGKHAVLTGQLACALYGFPRPVFALDMLVDLPIEQMSIVASHLGADFLVGALTPISALSSLAPASPDIPTVPRLSAHALHTPLSTPHGSMSSTPVPVVTGVTGVPRASRKAGMRLQSLQSFHRLHVLHYPTLVGVNLLVPAGDQCVRIVHTASRGARRLPLGAGRSPLRTRTTTPEDTALLEMLMYHLAGDRNDDAWNNILGILKVQEPSLRLSMLLRRGERLGLGDLLRHALDDAGLTERLDTATGLLKR